MSEMRPHDALRSAGRCTQSVPVHPLSSSSLADCRHRVSRHQIGADHLVHGDLPDQSGQDRFVGPGAQATTGRELPTAWLIQHKLMQAMADREDRYLLEGKVQVDDAYLGGERTGGKVGRGSENKVSFVAAVSLTDENRPLRVRLTPVPGFTLKAIAVWAKFHLVPGSVVFSDGLACFGTVTAAGCSHLPTVMAGRKPKEVPEFIANQAEI